MINHSRTYDNLYFLDSLSELERFSTEEIPGSFWTTLKFPNEKELFFCGLIDWQQTPAVFTAIKFNSTGLSTDELALVDVFCELLVNQGYSRLNALGIREIDSFLRINHLVSSFSVSLNSLYPVFSKVKSELLKLIDETPVFDPTQKRSPILSVDYIKAERPAIDEIFEKTYLTLVPSERQKLIETIFKRHIDKALLRDGGGAQVVYCDESLVVIQYLGHCEFCSHALTTTLDYIQRVLQSETNHLNLRVVTDS